MKRVAKISALVIGGIYSISQIFDVYMTYKLSFKSLIDRIKQLDFHLIGQILVLSGLVIFLTTVLVFLLKRALGIKRPHRDALDYFAEIFLPEEQLDNSEPKHRKRLKKFNLLNIGLYIIVLGICLSVLIRVFDKTRKDQIKTEDHQEHPIDSSSIILLQ